VTRVLIVDDSLTVRMDLVEAFESGGLEPVPCASAAEARAAMARETFELVVLDVLLPDGDGVELLAEIRRSSTPDTAVMMLSSEAEVRDRVRGLHTGANEYVGKPYERGYVVARALELVRGRQPRVAGERSVLVIDDSPTFRAALGGALAAGGYQAVFAASGEEGLRVAADLRPTAVIVDGLLPGIDGITVIRRLRFDAALRLTPCVLLTGSEERGAELEALDAGADAFVRKDEDVAVILARLAAVLRGAPEREADGRAASQLGPKKILAVDDSATYLQELASALRGEGYDVVLAHSGEEALELLAAQSVACILMDLVMPGIGGREACRRIKDIPRLRDVPLILLTAQEERSAMIEGFAAGADDYIAKSADFDVLRARVRAQIRRRQFEEENRRFRERILRMELETSEARSAQQLAETRAALVEELEHRNQALRESEERLARVFETVAEGIFIVERDGRVSFANAMAETLLGLARTAPAQADGAQAWAFAAAGSGSELRAQLPVAQVMESGAPVFEVELVRERADGSSAVLSINAAPLREADDDIASVVCSVSDVTRRKEVESMKDSIVSMVSHELRTPLSSLRGFAELMLAREYPPEKRREFLTIIHGESVRLTSLINDFLDIQRLESGRTRYDFRALDVAALAEDTSRVCSADAEQRRIQLEFAPDLPRVLADADRIRQVLLNLLTNALKFSPASSAVTLGARHEGSEVVLSVTDRGIGIPPEALPQLFTKFFRVDSEDTRGVGGTGLGLALVKEIVKAHGGRVWVTSTPGRGSTFFFALREASSGLPSIHPSGAPSAERADGLRSAG